MILDALATFCTNQTTTTTVASTDIIDTVAAGDAYDNGAWFVFLVGPGGITTASTVPTFLIELQTSSDAFLGVGNDTTLVASAQFLASQLTAGKFWAVRIPQNLKRYLRGYKTVSTNTAGNYVTASNYSMFITDDINTIIGAERYML